MLAFERVSSRYGARTALDDVSFACAPGERIALVGPSGAGKTTIFRLAYGAFAPASGRVVVGGADLATLRGRRLRAARSTIAVVFQAHGLIDRLSVGQNVVAGTFGRRDTAQSLRAVIAPGREDRAAVRAALERVGLADRVADRASALSGGERQRVAIARAIVQEARLVLADEPVASLDPELGAEVVALLLSDAAARGATLVCSLHQPALAARFDRVIRVEGGRIVRDAPP